MLVSASALSCASSLLAQNGDRAGETQGDVPAEWQVKDAPVRPAADELGSEP